MTATAARNQNRIATDCDIWWMRRGLAVAVAYDVAAESAPGEGGTRAGPSQSRPAGRHAPPPSNPSGEVSSNGAPVILRSHGAGSRGQQSSAAPLLCRVEGVVEVASPAPRIHLLCPPTSATQSFTAHSQHSHSPFAPERHGRRGPEPWPAGVIPSSPSSPGRGRNHPWR